MTSALNNAASITPPVGGSDDIVVLASGTSAAALLIPRTWLRGWLTIMPEGCDSFIAFSQDSSYALDETDVTTLSSGAIASHGTAEAVKAKEDVGRAYDLSALPDLPAGKNWYLIHKESATGGYLRVEPSSGKSNRG